MSFLNPIRKHSEKILLGYSKQNILNLVSDTATYSEFVPFCKESIVLNSTKTPTLVTQKVKLVIGFLNFTEAYTSKVEITSDQVKAKSLNSELFETLKTTWKFKEHAAATIVDFEVEFKFRSLLHSQAAHLFMDKGVGKMVEAFEKRALVKYGPPAFKSKRLR